MTSNRDTLLAVDLGWDAATASQPPSPQRPPSPEPGRGCIPPAAIPLLALVLQLGGCATWQVGPIPEAQALLAERAHEIQIRVQGSDNWVRVSQARVVGDSIVGIENSEWLFSGRPRRIAFAVADVREVALRVSDSRGESIETELTPGQRVRVTAPSAAVERQVAVVDSVSGPLRLRRHFGHASDVLGVETATDARLTLTLMRGPRANERADTERVTVPLDSLTSLEVSGGPRSYAAVGALIGGLTLGVGGSLFGGHYLFTSGGGGGGFSPIPAGVGGSIVGGVGGAVLGALVGASVGRNIHTERWVPVPLRRARVSVSPLPGGRLRLGASLAF